jgi:hypothetical protein
MRNKTFISSPSGFEWQGKDEMILAVFRFPSWYTVILLP